MKPANKAKVRAEKSVEADQLKSRRVLDAKGEAKKMTVGPQVRLRKEGTHKRATQVQNSKANMIGASGQIKQTVKGLPPMSMKKSEDKMRSTQTSMETQKYNKLDDKVRFKPSAGALTDDEAFDPFFIDMMNKLLARGSEEFKREYIRNQTSTKLNIGPSQDEPKMITLPSTKGVKLRAIDFDPFCEYIIVNTKVNIQVTYDQVSIAPMVANAYLESYNTSSLESVSHPREVNSTSSLKTAKLIEYGGPIDVCTYFPSGREFRMFKYFYKTGEWRSVTNHNRAHYVHYTKEMYVDWNIAESHLVG